MFYDQLRRKICTLIGNSLVELVLKSRCGVWDSSIRKSPGGPDGWGAVCGAENMVLAHPCPLRTSKEISEVDTAHPTDPMLLPFLFFYYPQLTPGLGHSHDTAWVLQCANMDRPVSGSWGSRQGEQYMTRTPQVPLVVLPS